MGVMYDTLSMYNTVQYNGWVTCGMCTRVRGITFLVVFVETLNLRAQLHHRHPPDGLHQNHHTIWQFHTTKQKKN